MVRRPAFPVEIFAQVVDYVHPYDLMRLACTCTMLADLCKTRLTCERQLANRYKDLLLSTCLNHEIYEHEGEDNGDNSDNFHKKPINMIRFLREMTANASMPCHILHVIVHDSCAYRTIHPPKITFEGISRMLQMAELTDIFHRSQLLRKDEVARCVEHMRQELTLAPLLAAIHAQATRLLTLSVDPEALTDPWSQLITERAIQSNCSDLHPGAFEALEQLNISVSARCLYQYPAEDFSVDLLPKFRHLSSLQLRGRKLSRSADLKTSAIPVTIQDDCRFPHLTHMDLELQDISYEAAAHLFSRCPKLEKLSIQKLSIQSSRLHENHNEDNMWAAICQALNAFKPPLQSLDIRTGGAPMSIFDFRHFENLQELVLKVKAPTPLVFTVPRSIQRLNLEFGPWFDLPVPSDLPRLFLDFDIRDYPDLNVIFCPTKIKVPDQILYIHRVDQISEMEIFQLLRSIPTLNVCQNFYSAVYPDLGFDQSSWLETFWEPLIKDAGCHRVLVVSNSIFRICEQSCRLHHRCPDLPAARGIVHSQSDLRGEDWFAAETARIGTLPGGDFHIPDRPLRS